MTARAINARRGFAMIVAIAMVAVVGLALGAVLSLFHLDLRRTTEAAQAAQLRQLLVVGEIAARQRLAAGATPGGSSVALPAPLSADGAALEVSVKPGGDEASAAVVRVEAKLGRGSAAQTLRYVRGPNGWQLAGAELDPGT